MKAFRSASTLLLVLLISAGAAPQEKAPPPALTARKKAKKEIRKLLRTEFAQKEDYKRLSLAIQLLKDGIKTKDNPAMQYALFQEAWELAAKIGDVEVCVRAVNEVAARYDVDSIDLKMKILRTTARKVSTPAAKRLLFAAYRNVADNAVRKNRFRVADKACAEAGKIARKLKDDALIAKIKEKRKTVAALRQEFNELMEARRTLETNPEDPDANLRVGRYLCRVKEDWTAGLPLLAKGADPVLKKMAAEDLADPQDPEARAKLADAWYDLAGTHPDGFAEPAWRRSGHWYKMAFPDLTGDDQARVQKRLSELCVGFDILAGEWTTSKGARWTEDGIVIDDTANRMRRSSTARHAGRFEVGSKFEVSFTIDRIDRNQYFFVGMQLGVGPDIDAGPMDLYGWGTADNEPALGIQEFTKNVGWTDVADTETDHHPTVNSSFTLRLETNESSFRLSLHDADGVLLAELKKNRSIQKEFEFEVRAQSGKIRITRVVRFLP